MDENSLSHTRWKCQYHIVFIPKYRRKVLYGKVKTDVREILRTLCRYRKVEIIEGAVCADHVHLCLSIHVAFTSFTESFLNYKKYCNRSLITPIAVFFMCRYCQGA